MTVRTGDIYITGWDDPHVEIEAEKVVHANQRRTPSAATSASGFCWTGRMRCSTFAPSIRPAGPGGPFAASPA